MDELEVRRQLFADPRDKNEALRHAIASNPSNRKFYDDIQVLDRKIAAAMTVTPPDGLADRILLRQSFAINEGEIRRRAKFQLAIAASFAFFLGLSASLVDWRSFISPNLGSVALALTYDGMPFLQSVNESPSLHGVNAKLAPFGVSMKDLPTGVTYVNHCSYGGTPAFHMIMQGKMGPINVYVVPDSSRLTMTKEFSDRKMHGMTMSLSHANMVIVGVMNEPLEKTVESLAQNLNQSI
jgi:hypothetical protein